VELSSKRALALGFLPHVIAVLAFVLAISRFYNPREGFTSLIGFGGQFASRTVPAVRSLPRHVYRRSSGYDGQFYAQIATDPLLKDPATDQAMDDMPLRARRILFAWTAYIAGVGRPWWILQAYALQNVVCWIALSLLLLRWFEPGSTRMAALWTATLFSGGLLWSVRFALLDGPSLLLIAASVAALERGRSWLATAVLSVASLGRETNLLAASILPPPTWSWRAVARTALQAVLVIAPLVIWFDYLYSLYRDRIYTSGGTMSLPFSALAWKASRVWGEVAANGLAAVLRPSVLTLLSLIVQAGYVVGRLEWKNPWWRLGIAYAALLPFLGRPLWEGEPATAMRVMIPLALAFNVLLRDCRDPCRFWSLLTAGNLTVLYAPPMLRVFAR
jgi:hypothetical protein